MRAICILVLAGLLAGCMPSSDAITDRPWRLVEIIDVPPAADAGISFGVDGRFAVRPGCNSGGGTYTIEGKRIVTGATELTAIACDATAEGQEETFLRILRGEPEFEIETRTGRLRLSAGDATLVFETP